MAVPDPRALLEACLHQTGELRLPAAGTSMWPELRAGDELRLMRVAYEAIRPGDILLVHQEVPARGSHPARTVLLAHRVLKTYLESGRAMLLTKGDHRAMADPPVFFEQVVGRVEEAWRAGQPVYRREEKARASAWRAAFGRLEDATWTWVMERGLGARPASPEAQALCELLSYCLDWTAVPALPAQVDWREVYALARAGRFTPLLSHKPVPGAPAWFTADCQRDLRENQAHRLLLDQQLGAVVEAFAARGVPVLVVKGPVHAEQLYANPYWRPMVDLDLVVRPEHWEAGLAVLASLGFEEEQSRWARLTERLTGQVAMLKPLGPFVAAVELHRNLDILSERLAVRGSVQVERAWDEALEVGVGGVTVETLSPEAALAYASTHWAQHHFYNSVWLLDIALMASRPGLDWQKLVDDAQQDGTANFVWTSLSLAESLYGAPVPRAVLAALRPSRGRAALVERLSWAKASATFEERADVRSLLLQLALVPRWRWALGGLLAGVFPSRDWLCQHYVAASGERAGHLRLLGRHWRRLGAMVFGVNP
ncbi:MAG: nucleotidyltransferase family protein [Candidatus Sericytochromatia bacterium]|nr:nucleotidyltransferase family protein [Candidatus Sericytochromatia bacterium]